MDIQGRWWTSDTLGGQTFARQNAYKKDYKIEQIVNCKNQSSLLIAAITIPVLLRHLDCGHHVITFS